METKAGGREQKEKGYVLLRKQLVSLVERETDKERLPLSRS